MRISLAILTLLASCPAAFADVEFTSPAAGASVPGGTAFSVTWKDSGNAPSLSDLTSYQLFLCTGSNTDITQLYPITTAGTFTSSSQSVTIPVGTGGSTKNAYFLKMISVATAGGTVINYSDRFTLTGMTGVFSAAVTTDLASITGTDGPPTVNNVASAAATTASPDEGAYGTPYSLQTGPTRYAPMQPVPGTKITATNTAPLFPTSSVVLATTYLAPATVDTTITQAQTSTVASHTNTAAAASQPVGDMQKFLNRWKD